MVAAAEVVAVALMEEKDGRMKESKRGKR